MPSISIHISQLRMSNRPSIILRPKVSSSYAKARDPQRLLTGSFVITIFLAFLALSVLCKGVQASVLDDTAHRIIASGVGPAEFGNPALMSNIDAGESQEAERNRLFNTEIMHHMLATNHVDRMEDEAIAYDDEVPSASSTSSMTTSTSTPDELHICPRGASCGQLQANARGISVVKYCTCRKSHYAKMLGMSATANDCPLTWDAEDGKSISQGSNQFKFCEPVPEVKKSYCAPNEVAYVVTTAFPHNEAERIEQNFRHYCTCPPGTKFDVKRYHTQESHKADVDVAEYICVPLPVCSAEDSCKTVTETSDSFLVENNCKCPPKTRCPTNGRPSEEMDMGKGVVKLIRCQ